MIVEQHIEDLKKICERINREQTQQCTIYPAYPGKKSAITELIDSLKYYINNEMSILDIGACDGYLGREIESGYGVKVISCDCNPQSASVERAALPELPYAYDSFDLIVSRHCLEHSLTLPLDLLEIRRVLVTGGILAVVVPDIYDEIILNHENHVMILPREAWRKVFGRFGFEILSDTVGTWAASKVMKEWRFIMRKRDLQL